MDNYSAGLACIPFTVAKGFYVVSFKPQAKCYFRSHSRLVVDFRPDFLRGISFVASASLFLAQLIAFDFTPLFGYQRS